MRKPFCIALALLLLSLTACARAPAARQLSAGVAGLWFTEELPGDTPGSAEALRVGRTYDGKDIFTLLHVPLPGGIQAEDVREAWLHLKILENNGGSALRAGTLGGPWEETISCARAKTLAKNLRPVPQAETPDGWLLIDVTDPVRLWLSGRENHGLALFEANGSTETVFAATGEHEPRLEILTSK